MFNVYMTSKTMKLLPLLCLCLLTRSGTTFAYEQGGTVKDRLGEIIAGFPTGWVVAVVLGVIGIVLLGTVAMILRQSYRRNSYTEPPKDPSTGLDVIVKRSALDVVAVDIVLVCDVVVLIPSRQLRNGLYTLWVVAVVLGVIGIVLLRIVARTLRQRYRRNSYTGFLTGWVVAVVLGVIGIVLLRTVARTLRQRYRRNSYTEPPKESFTGLRVAAAVLALIPLLWYHTESYADRVPAVLSTVVVVVLAVYLVLEWAQHLRGFPTGLRVAVDVVLAVAVLALIPLWCYQSGFPAELLLSVLCTVVVVVVAVCLVLEWAQHLRGQRTNSNAMTENVRPNQNGEESPEEESNSSVSGEGNTIQPPHSTQNLLSTSVVLEPHTNGQRTNSNAMTENDRPNQNGEESPEEASNSSVSGEDEQVKGHVSHGPDELTELKHGPHDDLLY